MVRKSQVVVNGLRASDKTGRVSRHNSVVGKFLDGVHGVISTDIDKRLNIQLVENRKNFLVHRFILMNLRQFVAAGSEESCRRPLQKFCVQLCGDIL